MSGSSPKQFEANKTGDACGLRTPADGVAAIPDPCLRREGRGQASDRGSLTIVHKSFGVPEDTLVEKIAVAPCCQFVGPNSSSSDIRKSEPQGFRPTKAFKIAPSKNAIERQLHKSGEACGLFIACKNTAAFITLSPRRRWLSSKIKKLPNKPISLFPSAHGGCVAK
jgi:hypothetical protein